MPEVPPDSRPSLLDRNYRCLVANTRTGAILDELPMTGFSWRDSLDWARPGSMSVNVQLLGETRATDPAMDASVRAKARAVASAHWFTSLVLVRDTTALYAAPVVSHTTSGRAVTFTCSSLRKLFDARMVIAAGYELTPNAAAANFTSSADAPGTVRNLFALATTGTGRALPLSLPPAMGAMSDIARTFDSVDLASVGERVEDIVGEDGGPDVLIRPSIDLNATQLTWTVSIGQPRIGSTAVDWVWDYGINCDIDEDKDSSNQTSRWYQVGDGLERDRLISVVETSRFVGDGWPSLERASRDNASIKEPVQLDALARASAATNADGITQWSISVDPDADPFIGRWGLGDLARFEVRGHPLIDDGSYIHRLVGVEHSPGKASLGTTPVLAVA